MNKKATDKERKTELTLQQNIALATILVVNAPPPPLKAAPATWKR